MIRSARRGVTSLALSVIHVCLLVGLFSACGPSSGNGAASPGRSTAAFTYSLAGGGGCAQLGEHPHELYANVRASYDGYQAHSETMIVEDPHNPLHLVGGAKFFPDIQHYRFKVGFVTSFDGGCTWKDGGALPGFNAQTVTSDPSFAFGPHGEVYAAVLYDSAAESGIAVYASHDGGKTFEAPVKVFGASANDIFSDKPWMTVDQTSGAHAGDIYVAWSYDHGYGCGYGNFCHQNLAFSLAQLIEGSALFCANPTGDHSPDAYACDGALGVIPVVQPDGTVVIVTAYEDVTGQYINGLAPTRLIEVLSRDGGKTWSKPVFINFVDDVYGWFPPERYRNTTLPAFACDPKTGQLYLAWSNKGTRDADILFSTSRDDGRTWSIPIRVNDDGLNDGANQFQPQLAVAPDGVISVSFFDTRVDPHHLLVDVFLAQSINHGVSFLQNARVTSRSFDPVVGAPTDEYGSLFIGDYQGLAADNMFAHAMWNDARSGVQELFTAAVPSAQP